MSMSFPYFFEPVTLRRNGEPHLIVDGGLLSNFPVFLFDGDKPPLRRWTFGFRLFSGTPPERPPYRRVPRPLWQLPLGKAMFFAATEAWDQRLSQATLVRTIRIPTGNVPTLDFTLSGSDRDMLRASGHAAAEQFFATQRRYINPPAWRPPGPPRSERRCRAQADATAPTVRNRIAASSRCGQRKSTGPSEERCRALGEAGSAGPHTIARWT
jgi:NTE family protein